MRERLQHGEPIAAANTLQPSEISISVPPQTPRLWWDKKALVSGGAALVLFALLWMRVSPPDGEITVNVVGPEGGPVDSVNVYLNEELKCDEAPCVLKGIEGKPHAVSFQTTGLAGDIVKSVGVRAPAAPAFEAPVAVWEAPTDPVLEVAALPTTPEEDLGLEPPQARRERPEPASRQQEAAPERKRTASTSSNRRPTAETTSSRSKLTGQARPRPASGGTRLNVYSTPSASVLVDGRPRGTTPLIGLEVEAGAHTVVLVHPMAGRRRVIAKVGVGEQRSVNIKF